MSEAMAGSPSVKRGRKPETAAQRMERLQRQLEEAKRMVKEEERRKFAVVGEAILSEAHGDAEFNTRVLDILRRRVASATAKADIAELLAK